MSLPKTYSSFRRTKGSLPITIQPATETLPEKLSPNEVIIKIHAVSLNFRDVAMLDGTYPAASEECGIPVSDCAAEVVAIGPAVVSFKVGDRVSPIFDLENFTGVEDNPTRALGGNGPGVLREYAVFEDKHLVHLPSYLTWEEASTIACAGVTAWVALDSPGSVSGEKSALLQGTGGVSMFALLLCIAAGIKPIITSSSDEKLDLVKKLSPTVFGINYKTTIDQGAEILDATNGKGVDIVINNIGPASIPTDISSLRRRGGAVSLVGFLGGIKADWDPSVLMTLMRKTARLRGIGVGSKLDYQRLNDFLEEKQISLAPIIDRTFSFHESVAAFDYLYSGKHVGKIIIKMDNEA